MTNKLKGIIVAILLLILAGLIYFSPTDASLGQAVKAVYLHGAVTWASLIMIMMMGVAGTIYLLWSNEHWFDLASRSHRLGTLFWVINFFIWVPLSQYAWNNIFAEPRAVASVWAMLALGVGYVLSLLLNNKKVLAALYAATGLGIIVAFSAIQRMLHPLDPIGGSEGLQIKAFFVGILIVTFAIAMVLLQKPKKTAKICSVDS